MGIWSNGGVQILSIVYPLFNFVLMLPKNTFITTVGMLFSLLPFLSICSLTKTCVQHFKGEISEIFFIENGGGFQVFWRGLFKRSLLAFFLHTEQEVP